MGTPIQKEFGPGYDSPPRKFHFWAVILPTVVLIALAVALMRDTGSTSSKLTRSPIVTCPKQMCPAPGATESAQPAKKTSTATDGTAVAKATLPPAKSGGAKANGRAPTNGRKPAAGKRATNGKAAGGDDSVEDAPAPKSHPRSRAKRTRKAR